MVTTEPPSTAELRQELAALIRKGNWIKVNHIPEEDQMNRVLEIARTADAEYVEKICGKLIPDLAAKHGVNDFSRMIASGKDPAACLHRP